MKLLNFFDDFNDAPRQDQDAKPYVEPLRAFQDYLEKSGMGCVEVVPDGKLHRFDTPEDRPGQKTGWYVFYTDNVPAGAFGDWRNEGETTWSFRSDLSHQEKEDRDRRILEAIRQREDETSRVRQEAAERAREIWSKAKMPKAHPYLHQKQVSAYGIRQDKNGCLLVPVADAHGTLHSLQYLSVGDKKFLTGGAVQGHFHLIPGVGEKTYIVEGYATGATVHKATGAPVAIAFNAGNIKPVAEQLQGRIIIAADNDHTKPENTGLRVAKESGYPFVFPQGMQGTDWNDLMVEKGLDEVRRQIGAGVAYRLNLLDWGLDKFKGPAPARRWLVEAIIPMGAPMVLAARGDTGKGILMLDLALKVGGLPGDTWNPVLALGRPVTTHGTAVILTAEDDKDEMHRRLEQIGYTGHERVLIVPLPNAGGPAPIVRPGRNGPEATPLYYEIKEQLMQIPDLALLNVDPLSSFVMADVNSDPAVGAFTMGLLASIGTETGACILVCHHLAKTQKTIRTADDARNLVRGSTAIVDNSRAVFVLWPMDEKQAQQTCNALGVKYAPNMVVRGCVVKSNGPADRTIRTFVRNPNSGLLEVRDDVIRQSSKIQDEDLMQVLVVDIADAAEAGYPFCKGGQAGLYERRDELHELLRDISRDKFRDMVNTIVEQGRVVKCRASGSKIAHWLDVPDGKFARGEGEFPEGARD